MLLAPLLQKYRSDAAFHVIEPALLRLKRAQDATGLGLLNTEIIAKISMCLIKDPKGSQVPHMVEDLIEQMQEMKV